MTYRKKLIEVALPLEAINEASAREKSIRHGHPSTLHLWWARRPLAAARAVIFASLVDDPDSPDALPAFVEACRNLPYIGKNVHTNGDTPRMRLFDFIELLVKWESTTDEEILNTARELIQIATEGNPPPLLDPFAGGGSIPLEAQRLGLEAHASDLNPVAVMINKAQIEIPPRFANLPPVNPRDRAKMFGGENQSGGDKSKGKNVRAQLEEDDVRAQYIAPPQDTTWKGAAGLAADVRYYGEWMREKAWERIGHLYPTHNGETVIAWLWARTVKSPNPAVNAHVPLVRSFILSKKKGREYWAKPIVEDDRVRFEVTPGTPPKGKEGTVTRQGGICIISGEPITLGYIQQEGKAGRMGRQLMSIVTVGKIGRNYYSPNVDQETVANIDVDADLLEINLPYHPRHLTPPNYGLTLHRDLYTERQLTVLKCLSDLVQEAKLKIASDAIATGFLDDDKSLEAKGTNARAYAEANSLYLTFALAKTVNRASTMCTWKISVECPGDMFARQALSMTWDYSESNILRGTTGSFESMLENTVVGLEMADTKIGIDGYAVQADAAKINSNHSMLVSTDPPYYDNVPYADLSDIFYVWERPTLIEAFPEIMGTLLVPKTPEIVADPVRHGNWETASQHFEQGLRQAFKAIRTVSDTPFPVSVYYAFKQADLSDTDEAGDLEISSRSSTGWETMLEGLIDAHFTINGTWPVRTERQARTRNLGSNALASSIVLVCRPRPEDAPTISRRGFVDTLRRELPAALKEMQSGNIAPVDLAQASIGPGMGIYSRYSRVLEADGSPLSVRTALGLINQELDAYLAEQDGDIDADTRFAVAWFEQFAFNEGEFGQADTLARAKNTSVAGVEAAQLVASGRGKVRLMHWSEYDPGAWDPRQDKRPTIWEATHHLIERLNTHGETGSAMLMQKMPPDMAAEARNLAYRLYSICERKGWADHARDYNALVISWAGIGEETARLREAQQAGDATEQGRLQGFE